MKIRQWEHFIAWGIVLAYVLIAALTQLGHMGAQWDETVGPSYQAPCWSNDADRLSSHNSAMPILPPPQAISVDDPLAHTLRQLVTQLTKEHHTPLQHPTHYSCSSFGFDRWGRNILDKTLQGTRTSIIVGLGGAMLAILIGTTLGALAGFYAGGRLDASLNGLYNIFTSVPNLLLIMAIAALLEQHGLVPMVLILGFTGWTGVFRLLRAEYIKHRSRDYVLAATLLGASPTRLIVRHILPNTLHLIGVQIAILTVGFIKSEVILSFLGLGVSVDEVSWGTMLSEAQSELLIGFPWQLIAATIAMSGLSVALSRLTDEYTDPTPSVH